MKIQCSTAGAACYVPGPSAISLRPTGSKVPRTWPANPDTVGNQDATSDQGDDGVQTTRKGPMQQSSLHNSVYTLN